MKTRIIVVPIITNQNGEYLICKMSKHKGVFPGQWGLPGGGIEPNERMCDALHREVREELGIKIDKISPWNFRDDLKIKTFSQETKEEIYMVYLIFDCCTDDLNIVLNDEFEKYAWVKPEHLSDYDLNEATKITFKQKNILSSI